MGFGSWEKDPDEDETAFSREQALKRAARLLHRAQGHIPLIT